MSPYGAENVLLCPLIWINHQLQKMGTYTAEKGYLYQIYFYRYIFIGRKMSLYKSENVPLWVGKCPFMGLINIDNTRPHHMPKRIKKEI